MDATATSPTNSTSREPRPKRQHKTVPRLRDITPSSRCFWKEDIREHLAQQIKDRTYDSTNERDLPANEIDALALNEIAVAHKDGFFFFLPSRTSWSRQTFEPSNRGPAPGSLRASVPSLVFMRHTWSEKGQLNFLQAPHRSRYLACDFQLNPPPAPSPLYCIQVVSGPLYPVFNTSHTSFIIVRADPMYFGTVAELAPILGLPARKRKGPDAAQRLGQVEGCWGGHGSPAPRFQQYVYTDMKSLYKAIIMACHPTKNASSMTSAELWTLLPRPSNPEIGSAIGLDSLYMPIRSRFGGRQVRRLPVEEDANESMDS